MKRTLVVVVVIAVLTLVGLTVLRSKSHRDRPVDDVAKPVPPGNPVWEQATVREDPHFAAGVKLAVEGKLAESEVEFRKYLEAHPRSPEVHMQIAGLYQQQDRLEEALAEVTKALEIKPDLPNALYDRAYLLLTFGRDEEAAVEVDALEALRKDAAEPYFLRCAARVDDDPKFALTQCEEYVRRAWLGKQQVPTAEPPRAVIERELLFGVAKKALGDERAAAAYLGERYLDLAVNDQFREMSLYYLQKYVDLTSVEGDPDKARFERTLRIYKDVQAQARRALAEIPGLGALDEADRMKVFKGMEAEKAQTEAAAKAVGTKVPEKPRRPTPPR